MPGTLSAGPVSTSLPQPVILDVFSSSAHSWSDPSLHFATAHWGHLTEGCSLGAGETVPSVTSCGQFKNQCHLKVHSTGVGGGEQGVGVLAAKHLNKCQMTTHHARYRVCGYYDFPTLNRFYLFLYIKKGFVPRLGVKTSGFGPWYPKVWIPRALICILDTTP